MLKTLQMLNRILTKESADMSLEEIARAYQVSLSPSLLARAFNKTFGLTMSIANKFYGLNSDDVASYSLEKLDRCLLNYDGQIAKFSTYYTVALRNKFREETEALNTHKRKAVFTSDYYGVAVGEKGNLDVVGENDEFLLLQTLMEMKLTDRELTYCRLVLKDISNFDIANQLQVSLMTLTNIRKKLRVKLKPLALSF